MSFSPRSSFPNDYQPYLTQFLTEDNSSLLGDENAHSSLRNYNIPEDARGGIFTDEIINSSFTLLNSSSQTRLPYDNTNSSSLSPDVS